MLGKGLDRMMHRKYCREHDSLWWGDDVCEAVVILMERDRHAEVKDCWFETVDLVRIGR